MKKRKSITEVVHPAILARAEAGHQNAAKINAALPTRAKWWVGSRTDGKLIDVDMDNELSPELIALMVETASITAGLEKLKNG